MGESLASVIPQCTKVPSDYLKYDIVNKMYLDPVTENEIDKIILNFLDSSAGWDELKPTVIKSIRYCIKSPLRHICNLSFRTGIFPDELKIAIVVPIFKSGDELILSNYRPVSVCYPFSQRSLKDSCTTDFWSSPMITTYYASINSDFKRGEQLTWLWLYWLMRYLKH